ncbi:MAG: 3-phosphoglycerate dehydrogenase, partial [Isosphaeraceae bacterium]
ATTVDALIHDLLDWIGPNPLPYTEDIEAWRTSCPLLPVWEEANDRGFVERRHDGDRGAYVGVSALGLEFLKAHRAIGCLGPR